MKKILKLVAVLSTVLTLRACSTIMTGTSNPLTVNSNVHGAEVYIDGTYAGMTPFYLDDLSTKKDHVITIKAKGYSTVTEVIKRKPSGWVFGNLLFGGISGLVIDIVSGGLYVFEKDNVNGNLIKLKNLKN